MNTTFENMGTTVINPHPTSIMIYMDGAALVTIRPNGVIEYGPDYTPDAAAKAFWEAIGAGNPLTTRVAELEMDAARWRKVEAMMVHQRCGPNFGWTIDTLLPGDSPTDAVDAAPEVKP